MIVGNELRNWLMDPEGQRRTRSAVVDFAARWRRGSVQKRFADTLASLPEESGQAVVDAVSALFADDSWIATTIESLGGELSNDPFFEPPFRALNSDIHSGLLIFDDERVSIAMGVTGIAQLAAKKSGKRGATSIGFTGYLNVLKIVKAGGAYISLWEAPVITGDFAAEHAPVCRRTGDRHLQDGDILVFDGRFQSYVIEHATSDILLLQASVKLDQAPLTVEYDSATQALVGASANDETASRIQMITTFLRKMRCEDAFPAVEPFLDDPHFFVRWHVMRELLGIDAQAALPHLQRMSREDAHPDVRRAARTVLDGLASRNPQTKAAVSCHA